MPSHRQPVTAVSSETVTRPRRITKSKSKAGTTKQQATSPTARHIATGAAPQLDPMDINSLVSSFEAHFQEIDDTMYNNLLEMQQSNTETFSQIMEWLDIIYTPTTTAVLPVTPTVEIGFGNILSRWAWVEQSVVESIANGKFDIHSLPKLHRIEELHHRHIAKVTEGYRIPLDGSKPELLIGRTKMHAAFKDLPTFLLAWFVYISIRTSYAPERGPALNLWTERVIFYVQSCGYSWSTVLNYVISYYQKHQDSSADAWFSVDPELVANHFAVAQQVPSSIVPTIPSPSRKTTICLNWNRVVGCNFDGCVRRHACAICQSSEHKSYQCPSKLPSADGEK